MAAEIAAHRENYAGDLAWIVDHGALLYSCYLHFLRMLEIKLLLKFQEIFFGRSLSEYNFFSFIVYFRYSFQRSIIIEERIGDSVLAEDVCVEIVRRIVAMYLVVHALPIEIELRII